VANHGLPAAAVYQIAAIDRTPHQQHLEPVPSCETHVDVLYAAHCHDPQYYVSVIAATVTVNVVVVVAAAAAVCAESALVDPETHKDKSHTRQPKALNP
jgi:hypothetical protein